MGGQNHQPCRFFLQQSTKLSQSVSNLTASCHNGNSAIEEIVLGELTGDADRATQGVSAATKYFRGGTKIVEVILEDLAALTLRMDELEFQDSPSRNQLDLQLLEHALVEQGMIPPASAAWRSVIAAYVHGGFHSVFQRFYTLFESVAPALREMNNIMTTGTSVAQEGRFNSLVEANGLPLRQSFNRLLTAMGAALDEFRCSSLLSTQLHLMDMGFPTFIAENVKATATR